MDIAAIFHDPLFILLIGVIIVVGGIIVLELHPFLSLLIAAFIVALLTPESAIINFGIDKGMTPEAAKALADKTIGTRIATEFGNTCAKIGILIAMAAIIGKCMLESGAAERIVRSMLKATGVNNAPIAFLFSSFFLGIPVFFDIVIFLMIPLAKAVAMRVGKNYLLLVLAITGGAAMANSFVPPAPGPLFLISEMNIPIGMMMIGGTLLGLVTISVGYLFAAYLNKKWPIMLRDSAEARLDEIKALAEKTDAQLPKLTISLLPVLVPLVLICGDNILNWLSSSGHITDNHVLTGQIIAFFKLYGDKNIALVSGGIIALAVLASQKKGSKEGMTHFVQTALMSGGGIILITAAGGSFGGILQQTGISLRIAELTKDYQMALIPLAFVISAVVRTAQGSATVALITASGILSGLATSTHLEFHPIYLGLAIGCGSKIVPWMNDAGFWIIVKISNLTEREALRTFSPMLVVMGTVGIIVLLIAAQIFPLV